MILLLTRKGKGFGLGHFKRMEVLRNFLIAKGIDTSLVLLEDFHYKFKNHDILMVDAREVDERIVRDFVRNGKILISLDDLETFKPYVISVFSLPHPDVECNANFEGVEYLILDPSLLKIEKSQKLDVLITFGGEDPNNLTEFVLRNFRNFLINKTIGVYVGELFRYKNSLETLRKNFEFEIFYSKDFNLYDLMACAEVVITSFGITVYEALVLGKKVILFNNSKYHHDLSVRSGLLGKGVFEVGYLDNGVFVENSRDVYFGSLDLRIDILENLERWYKLFKKMLELRNFDISKFWNAKVVHRDSNKTIFDTNSEKVELCF